MELFRTGLRCVCCVGQTLWVLHSVLDRPRRQEVWALSAYLRDLPPHQKIHRVSNLIDCRFIINNRRIHGVCTTAIKYCDND